MRQHHRARPAEKIDRSYLCRVLRLTLLAPEIVELIVHGRQPEWATLPALMKGFRVEWGSSASLVPRSQPMSRDSAAEVQLRRHRSCD